MPGEDTKEVSVQSSYAAQRPPTSQRLSSGFIGERSRKPHVGIASPKPLSLRRLSTLGRLTQSDEDLIRSLKPTTFSAGSVLSGEGAAGEGAFILLAGWCARRLEVRQGRNRVAFLLLPGDAMGLHSPRWAVDDIPVVALTTVIAVNGSELKRVLAQRGETHAALAAACGRAVWRDQNFCLNAVLRLGQQNAAERFAHLLLELHMRLSEVGLVANDRFELPVSQDVLAQALGLSHVHLSRTLRAMKRDHWIELEPGYVRLLEIAQIKALAGFTAIPLLAAEHHIDVQ